MPPKSTYNPDSLTILASGGPGGRGLHWQIYSYAGSTPRVRFVQAAKNEEFRKVDHFNAEDLAALASLAPVARAELLEVSAPPPAPESSPDVGQLLSELAALRAQVATMTAVPRPSQSPSPAASAPTPAPAPRKAKRPAPAVAGSVPSVSAARAAILGVQS